MAAWYIARSNEFLIDMDRAFQPMHESGRTRFELFFRRRLRDAERAGLFMLRKVVVEPSYSDGNVHVFVELTKPMTDLERLIWQSWLGSDLYRSRTDLKRYQMKHMFPSLLIAPKASAAFREPDDVCDCDGKHETVDLYDNPDKACSAWHRYRGPTPWECFGEPASGAGEGFTASDVPFGVPVPLSIIRRI